MLEKEYVKICQKCGSTNIKISSVGGLAFIGSSMAYYCKECNYGHPFGAIFPEIKSSEIKEFRKSIKKKK